MPMKESFSFPLATFRTLRLPHGESRLCLQISPCISKQPMTGTVRALIMESRPLYSCCSLYSDQTEISETFLPKSQNR